MLWMRQDNLKRRHTILLQPPPIQQPHIRKHSNSQFSYSEFSAFLLEDFLRYLLPFLQVSTGFWRSSGIVRIQWSLLRKGMSLILI